MWTNAFRFALLIPLCGLVPANASDDTQVFNTEKHRVAVETVASGLNHPWGLAFLPNGALLVTERSGQLRIVDGGDVSKAVGGVPKVAARGQGGLLDVALDPDFAQNSRIYLSYAEPGAGGAGTAVVRAILDRTGSRARLTDASVIFRQNKKTRGGRHFGSRLVFAPDGTLFVTVGERGDPDRAQDPFDHAGSVIRINPDGSIPSDNPFADGSGGLPEIWSIGHRNPQGAAIDPRTGALWTIAHGARGGDEINIPKAGKNYGWPEISYGRHYSGAKIGIGTAAPGFEQPIHYWDPSIAPSGTAFYTADRFPAWKGNLFVGALKDRTLVRLILSGDKVVSQERLFENQFGRIRDVRQGPDGLLYVLIDDSNGSILRLSPR